MKLIKQQIWRQNPENIFQEFIYNQAYVSIIDVIGRIIYANNKFSDLIGIPNNKIKGELNEILKSERHSNPVYKNLWAVIKNGQVWQGVLSGFTDSGKMYKLDVTIIPGRNKDGEIDKFVTFYFNTKAKDATELRIETEEFANKIHSESIAKTVMSINNFGEVLYTNKGFGFLSQSEVIGSSFLSFFSPIFHDMINDIIKNVFNEGKPDSFETIGMNSHGVNTIFSSQIGPVINNRGVVVSATISTQEMKPKNFQMTEEVNIEDKYHAIFQSMKVGIIVVVNDEGKITEWNKGAEAAFGYTRNEIKGEYLTKLLASKKRKSSVLELLKGIKKLQNVNSIDTVEMRGLKKNGTEFPVEFALSKWVYNDTTYYSAMMLDITKRKNLQNRLKLKTKELELFFYRSAHDLRAPIVSAEGVLNLIKSEPLSKPLTELTDMLDVTLTRGKVMVDDLIQASEVSARKKDIKTIDFKNIVAKVLHNLQGEENFNNVVFKIEISDNIEYYSSKELIISLFQNLIQNAIKYGGNKRLNGKAIVSVEVKGIQDYIKINIEDNGKGIVKKNLSKIFNMYFRENDEETPGSGLGLYIVKNIVEELKGEIKVQSKVNEGTSFKIKLQNLKKVKIA